MSRDTPDTENDRITVSVAPVQQSRAIQEIVAEIESTERGAPIEEVLDRAEENGYERREGRKAIERLQMWGTLYEPREDVLRVT